MRFLGGGRKPESVQQMLAERDSAERVLHVVIAHPDEIIRRGLESILSGLPQVAMTSACSNWDRAERMLVTGSPTSVLVVSHQLVAAHQNAVAQARSSGVRLIVMLEQLERKELVAAAGLCPDGFLLEGTLSAEVLAEALWQLGRGQIPMPTRLARNLMTEVQWSRTADPDRPYLLTPREIDTLRLLVEGCSNKQIATRLGIGINGAKRHVSNVLAKLNCPNRTLAAAHAVRLGLV